MNSPARENEDNKKDNSPSSQTDKYTTPPPYSKDDVVITPIKEVRKRKRKASRNTYFDKLFSGGFAKPNIIPDFAAGHVGSIRISPNLFGNSPLPEGTFVKTTPSSYSSEKKAAIMSSSAKLNERLKLGIKIETFKIKGKRSLPSIPASQGTQVSSAPIIKPIAKHVPKKIKSGSPELFKRRRSKSPHHNLKSPHLDPRRPPTPVN